MIRWGNHYGVRLDGDKAVTWYDSYEEAAKAEFERLWATPIRRARAEGRRLILTADVAEQARRYLREDQ